MSTSSPAARWNLNYTPRDLFILGTLGLLAGVVNTGLHQLWMMTLPSQWSLNGALVQGGFAWAYLLGFYLVRKPGSFLVVGILETAVQALVGSLQGVQVLGWGLTQALAAEAVMALAGYRSAGLLLCMLAGAAAAQAHTLWTMRVFGWNADPAVVRQYWIVTPINLLSGALLSGAVGYALGRFIVSTGLILRSTPSKT